MSEWAAACVEQQIQCSTDPSLGNILGDPVQVLQSLSFV